MIYNGKKTIYRDMTYLLNIQDEYYLTYIIPKTHITWYIQHMYHKMYYRYII